MSPTAGRRVAGPLASLMLSIACVLTGISPSLGQNVPQNLGATMKRLTIDLPASVALSASVRKPLDELSREGCDRQTILELGQALEKAGYRREAASAHISFSGSCGGYAPSLRFAANIMLGLSDFDGAAKAASDLIKIEPFFDNGYYLRALARDGAGMLKPALDDYITALELVGNKANISERPYFNMAAIYEKLGQFCDAALPIEAWVSLNPARNDTSQTQAIISNYMTKGKCAAATSTGEEVFPVAAANNVVKVPVTINGVRGNLIVDTGATFVSLKNSFAKKAKVDIDEQSTVRLHTANGITEGLRGRAKAIQLRSLRADDVPVVVEADSTGTYGDGIDGLLGMSFLSRFKMTIDTKFMKIAASAMNSISPPSCRSSKRSRCHP